MDIKWRVIRAWMIICWLALSMTSVAGAGSRQGGEKVVLALQWLTQCQFAGYYCALENGFYAEEGLDVMIVPGASDKNPVYSVAFSLADFGTKWLADFMGAKAEGIPLISIGQMVQSNGLILMARADSGIRTPRDFIGKRVGIWFFGNEVQFFSLMNQEKIPLDQVDVGEIKWSIQPFLEGKFDVTMAMVYNEYLRVLDNGYRKADLQVIDFSEYGLNYPGQVLFTRSDLAETRPDLCRKMLRAGIRGWAWAVAHPDEAVDMVMAHDTTKTLKRGHQQRQMREMIRLVTYDDRPIGYHEPDEVAFVMNSLVENKVLAHPLDLSTVYTNRFFHRVANGSRPTAEKAPVQ